MKRDSWFTKLVASYKYDFDYRLEGIIWNLTEDICRRMETLKMNRTQLAKKLAVSPAAVTKILNGNSNFTLRTLLSLSDAMDADLKIEFGVKTIDALVTTSDFRIYAMPESYFYQSGGGLPEPGDYLHKKRQNVRPSFCYAGAGTQQNLTASAAS